LVGNPQLFAIDCSITRAYEQLSLRGIGYFVIHILSASFGVCDPDATMLACSLDAVEKRVKERGLHTAPFSKEPDAGTIADAYCRSIYAKESADSYFGISTNAFASLFYSNGLQMAPDGDEAFDDGSFVLQFDLGEEIRLIAFKRLPNGDHDPATLKDLWMSADLFYAVLERWREDFLAQWRMLPKVPELLNAYLGG